MNRHSVQKLTNWPFVSVIVPVRNEVAHVKRAVDSILNGDYPADKLEVIVVDGMSDDGTREVVRRIADADPRTRLLDNPKQITPSAMNVGILAARGELFTRVDGHAEVAPDFIRRSVECLREHEDAWVVGGKIENVANGYVAQAIAAAMQSPVGVGNAMFRIGNYEGWVDTLAFGTHHKWIVDEIGYFDEQLVRNQDDDFNARIVHAGGKIWMSQAIRSRYFTRSSLRKLWRQYYQYGFWRIRTIQKHGKPASIRQMIPLLLVGSIGLLAAICPFCAVCQYLLVAELGLYTIGLLGGALDVVRCGFARHAPLAPLIFAILHFAYGLGCLWGIVRFILLRGAGLRKPETFALSR